MSHEGRAQQRPIHLWISSALPISVKLLALPSGRSLISFEILLSSLQFPIWDAKSVVVESSGGEAIADKSVEVINEFRSNPFLLYSRILVS